MAILAVCLLAGCNSVLPPEQTDFTAEFGRSDSTAAPDSIVWSYSGETGVAAVSAGQTSYSIAIKVANRKIRKDTLKLEFRTLSLTTYRIQSWAGADYAKIDPFQKELDSIANRMLLDYDSIAKREPSGRPWTHSGVRAFYAAQLFAGNPRYSGYPKNCPSGLDTLVVDSLVLVAVLGAKDSVGKYSGKWGLNWTPDQVKAVYRRWLGNGLLRQGQYDTLYPFDDRAPTISRKLVFTGTDDNTTIIRGGDAVKLDGAFADDTGVVSLSLRILSTPPGEAALDATSKFVLDTAVFPATPQKTWDLAGKYSIKTTAASNGLYQLRLIARDRKGQADTATYNFSVHEPGGVAIDEIAPTITLVLPSTRIDTVVDTVKSYLVRFGVSDENLKTVVLDGKDTVRPVNGGVEKRVQLVEGQTVTVRVFAADSSKNRSTDSVQIFRKVAELPKVTRNHPASGRDSVPDTTYTYSFKWVVDGADIDSIRIDSFGVLLDNQKVAEEILPLKLGATTRVKIRVVDKLRHVVIDSMDVVRGASVAPAVSRVGIPDGVVTVPDTQSYYTANWLVLDNNLQALHVLGKTATLTNSKCGATVFLKAGDTAKIPVWAQDKLGSVGTDTVRVWRPDPRAPYLVDIAAAQRGEAAIALTDYVLPNVRFARFETTVGLYDKVMDLVSTETLGKPKTNVSIYDAMLFCNALSKKLGLDTFYTYTSRVASTGYLNGYATRSDTVD
ncbi:MAG: hypothetical protein AAB214_21355, partial [Fibrobacterota bacterium]